MDNNRQPLLFSALPGSPCHPLQPPANGSLACDYWLYGRFCQMYCQEGTDLPRGSDDVGRLLVCNNNGEWTYKKKLPPCKSELRNIVLYTPLSLSLPHTNYWDGGWWLEQMLNIMQFFCFNNL